MEYDHVYLLQLLSSDSSPMFSQPVPLNFLYFPHLSLSPFDITLSSVSPAHMCMGVGPLVKAQETGQWERPQKIQVPTVPHPRVGPRELPASSMPEVWLACSCPGNYSCEVVQG